MLRIQILNSMSRYFFIPENPADSKKPNGDYKNAKLTYEDALSKTEYFE